MPSSAGKKKKHQRDGERAEGRHDFYSVLLQRLRRKKSGAKSPHFKALRAKIRALFRLYSFFFFNDTATTEIYTLSLHDALPICAAAKRTTAKRTTAKRTTAKR